MFDRKKQPQWLKLVNLLAVLSIILLVFIPLRDQPVWITILLLVIFTGVAAINFTIQFQDILFNRPSRLSDESVMNGAPEAASEKDESSMFDSQIEQQGDDR